MLDIDGVTLDHPGNNSYVADIEWSGEHRLAPSGASERF